MVFLIVVAYFEKAKLTYVKSKITLLGLHTFVIIEYRNQLSSTFLGKQAPIMWIHLTVHTQYPKNPMN